MHHLASARWNNDRHCDKICEAALHSCHHYLVSEIIIHIEMERQLGLVLQFSFIYLSDRITFPRD